MSQHLTIQSSSQAVTLTPKQANIFAWGWQRSARFRDAVCGRRFGKTFLGKAEMRRAARLAMKWNVSIEDEICYCAPTQKQAKRVFWRRLKQSIPPHWRAGKPNETELSITLVSGHILRCVGLNNYDDLRGSGCWWMSGLIAPTQHGKRFCVLCSQPVVITSTAQPSSAAMRYPHRQKTLLIRPNS